jgi:hypothetical protein
MRYLDQTSLTSTLNRGKSLEQFLGGVVLAGGTGIRWLELRPVSEGIEVWDFTAPDIGHENNLDFYEFGSDEDGTLAAIVPSPSEALAFAQEHLGALPFRWLNQFVAQDDYRDFISAGRPSRWPL